MKEINITNREREHFKKTFLYISHMFLCIEKKINIDLLTKHMCAANWKNQSYEGQDISLFIKNNYSLTCIDQVITVSIPSPYYNGFEKMAEIIFEITRILKEIDDSNTIIGMRLIKENRYQLKHKQNKGYKWLIQTLFSKDFIESIDSDSNNINFEIDSYKNSISIELSRKGDIDILKFRLSTFSNKKLNIDDFNSEIVCMNQTLYNIWRWAVSDNVIQMMNK